MELVPSSLIHLIYDLLALTIAVSTGWLTYLWKFRAALPATTQTMGKGYFVALSIGSISGAYFFGTLNLYLSDIHEISRSILGALFGATLTVELYKINRNISGSTGYIYIVPFCLCVVIGRLGCFYAGLHDQTFGTETTMLWGYDHGDGKLRHPVQLYESFSMLLCLAGIFALLKYDSRIIIRYGFYLCVGYYAFQRFVWEYFKPYHDVIWNLNIFQVLCLVFLFYSVVMIKKARHDSKT